MTREDNLNFDLHLERAAKYAAEMIFRMVLRLGAVQQGKMISRADENLFVDVVGGKRTYESLDEDEKARLREVAR